MFNTIKFPVFAILLNLLCASVGQSETSSPLMSFLCRGAFNDELERFEVYQIFYDGRKTPATLRIVDDAHKESSATQSSLNAKSAVFDVVNSKNFDVLVIDLKLLHGEEQGNVYAGLKSSSFRPLLAHCYRN